jgi:hypothetical protein
MNSLRIPVVIAAMAALLAVPAVGLSQSKGKQVRLQSMTTLSAQQRTRVERALPMAARKLGIPAPKGAASDAELDLMCGGDWFLMYDEDADGNPVTGTCIIACDGTDIPFC